MLSVTTYLHLLKGIENVFLYTTDIEDGGCSEENETEYFSNLNDSRCLIKRFSF